MNVVPTIEKPPMAEKRRKEESSGSTWLVLVPVFIFIFVLLGFALSLLLKKKPGKKLSQPDKSLNKLDYVKDVPKHEELDMDGLDDLSAEEREYIMGVLQKTNVVHSNY
jgi:hypothetical protein